MITHYIDIVGSRLDLGSQSVSGEIQINTGDSETDRKIKAVFEKATREADALLVKETQRG